MVVTSLTNCDELLEFMVETYDTPLQGDAEFQCDEVHFDGYLPDVRIGSKIIVSPKYHRTVFIVGEDNGEGYFLLSIIRYRSNFDQTPGVWLPIYVRDELIVTASGKWYNQY